MGFIVIPIIFIILKIGNDKNILKDKTNGLFSNFVGWITFVIMTISVILLFLTGIK